MLSPPSHSATAVLTPTILCPRLDHVFDRFGTLLFDLTDLAYEDIHHWR
jgi:hypothetical protein